MGLDYRHVPNYGVVAKRNSEALPFSDANLEVPFLQYKSTLAGARAQRLPCRNSRYPVDAVEERLEQFFIACLSR